MTIRGQKFRSTKGFWQGTHRTISPTQTLSTIRSYFPGVGLTRLSNITHLDRVGIPVTQAIRPNSATLTVSSGKGLSLEAALVSAAMEAIELYCAEAAQLPVIRSSYSDLVTASPCIPIEKLPTTQHSLFHSRSPELWCFGWDLIQAQEVAVPLELVILDYRLRHHHWSALLSFEMSSNGLASGNDVLEAITSALLELVERDATACLTYAQSQVGYQKPMLNLETIPSDSVQQLLDQFRSADLTPLLLDCTVDTEIPVYEACCYSAHQDLIPICHGYGAHLDPHLAMLRALTEAAQTRAIAISGARDDFFQSYYTSYWLGDGRRAIAALEASQPTVDARLRYSIATDTFEDDITLILTKLRQIGCQQAIIFDLTPPEWEISVVRVIVPGLEGYRPHDYRPKDRALAFSDSLCPKRS